MGFPIQRVDELRSELLDKLFMVDEEELLTDSCKMLEVDDPRYVSESYTLEKDGVQLALTSGGIELADGKFAEFCIIMDMAGGPEDPVRCQDFDIVYSRILDAEPEMSLDRANIEVALLRKLCVDEGYRVSSTTSGLMPLELPKDLVSERTRGFYEDIKMSSEEALERDILDGDAWRRRASALYFFGDLEGAEDALHRSLVLDPAISWPYIALGYLYLYKREVPLARWLFHKGQEAFSNLPLVRGPLAVLDIVHPRGRLKKEQRPQGFRFDGDVCPKCDRRSWKSPDKVRGECAKCGFELFQKAVAIGFHVLPRRFFAVAGERVVIELHVVNRLDMDLVLEDSGATIQIVVLDRKGRVHVEEIDSYSAIGREMIPSGSRFVTELVLDDVLDPASDLLKALKGKAVLDTHGSFDARIRDPPSKSYNGVQIYGLTDVYTMEILDLG